MHTATTPSPITLVHALPEGVAATERTVTLTGHGTVDVLRARVAVAGCAAKVLGYTIDREGRGPRAASLAAVREYGYDTERLTAAIADGLRG